MRILYLVPSFQHPSMRGPTRHYHFVKELGSRHRITLLALTRTDIPPDALAEMCTVTEKILTFRTHEESRRLPGGRFGHELQVRAAVAEMRAAFRALVAHDRYDVVLFHGKHLFPVIADCELPIVADFCDATSMRIATKLQFASWPRKPLLWLRYRQVRRLVADLARKTAHVGFITARDRDVVLGPDSQATIVPNGIDHRYWRRRPEARPVENCIIFTGVMDYAPNDDAAVHLIQDIAPLVRRAIPNLEILVVGRDPSRRVRELARRSPGVLVTGFVDDMRPYLEKATVCVAPLRYASGMQNKVLEALAMQIPVVATCVVAEGLRTNGITPPVLTARNALEFAEATVHLLRHASDRATLSLQGRRYVENNFRWGRSTEKLERMCLEAVAAAPATVPGRSALGHTKEVTA